MPKLIEIHNAGLFLPGDKTRRPILHDLDLVVKSGDRFFLTGPNGSGKSTFLRLLAGDAWATRGSILWQNSASRITARKIVRLVSPLQQNNYAIRNCWLPGKKLFPEQSLARLDQADYPPPLAMILNKAKELLDKEVGEMSRGQLRLLLLCGVLLASPKVLLLDEACDGLDAESRNIFFEILTQLPEEMAVICASHRNELPGLWQTLAIKDGSIKLQKEQEVAFVAQPEPVTLNVANQNAEAVYNLKNASVYINRQLILKNVTWRMVKGEHWQIEGKNGSGKSTFLRLLAGDECAAAGGSCEFYAEGEICGTLAQKRKRISLISDLSQILYDYDLTGLELALSGLDNTTGLYREFNQAEIGLAWQKLGEFFEKAELDFIANSSIRKLSTGQLRRLYLARAMMNEPKILLLDEPCSGLDQDARKKFLAALNPLSATTQLVFVSHYREDRPTCINRWAVMEDGKLNIKNTPGQPIKNLD